MQAQCMTIQARCKFEKQFGAHFLKNIWVKVQVAAKITALQQRFLTPVLQRHNTENLKQLFPEKKLRGHSPNFHIHVSVIVLYIQSVYSAAGK